MERGLLGPEQGTSCSHDGQEGKIGRAPTPSGPCWVVNTETTSMDWGPLGRKLQVLSKPACGWAWWGAESWGQSLSFRRALACPPTFTPAQSPTQGSIPSQGLWFLTPSSHRSAQGWPSSPHPASCTGTAPNTASPLGMGWARSGGIGRRLKRSPSQGCGRRT